MDAIINIPQNIIEQVSNWHLAQWIALLTAIPGIFVLAKSIEMQFGTIQRTDRSVIGILILLVAAIIETHAVSATLVFVLYQLIPLIGTVLDYPELSISKVKIPISKINKNIKLLICVSSWLIISFILYKVKLVTLNSSSWTIWGISLSMLAVSLGFAGLHVRWFGIGALGLIIFSFSAWIFVGTDLFSGPVAGISWGCLNCIFFKSSMVALRNAASSTDNCTWVSYL